MIARCSGLAVAGRIELEDGDWNAAAAVTAPAFDAVDLDPQRCPIMPFVQQQLDRTLKATHRGSRDRRAFPQAILDCRGTTRVHHQVQKETQAMVRLRMAAIAIGAAMAACLATPALAESKPSTRLVSCGSDSCLLVTGRRRSADAEVRINGHPVAVQGERSWRVRLPVSTVRDWSAPFARKIEVSSYNPAVSDTASHSAKLPIGLLGHVPDLASLVITLN